MTCNLSINFATCMMAESGEEEQRVNDTMAQGRSRKMTEKALEDRFQSHVVIARDAVVSHHGSADSPNILKF